MRRQRTNVAALLAVAFLTGPLTLGYPAARNCVDAKRVATARAFSCVATQESKRLSGGNANPERCDEVLARDFAAAESLGTCPTTDDWMIASGLVHDAETAVLELLMPTAVLTDAEHWCALKKNKFIAKYGYCVASRLNNLAPNGVDRRPFFRCGDPALQEQFARIEAGGGCLTSGDAEATRDAAGPSYGYMPGARLVDVNLRFANLPGATLTGADLSGSGWTGADLAGADLRGARMDNASMGIVNLREANLSNVLGWNTWVVGSDLTGADLSGADLRLLHSGRIVGCPAILPPGWLCIDQHILCPWASLEWAWLTDLDLTGVDLNNASLAYAKFSNSNLTGADLSEGDLRFANLSDVDLTGAKLTGAVLAYADLAGATFAGADLTGVFWLSTLCPDGTLNADDSGTCCDHYVGAAPAACGP